MSLGPEHSADVAIVGAGAAGLATAIFAARRAPGLRIVALDGAQRLGAKILVSGGGRCNVTNASVGEADFCGDRRLVRHVLRAFGAAETVAFFREIGVTLAEEAGGKLFPSDGRARSVLAALLAEAERRGVELRAGHRVTAVAREAGGFHLATSRGGLHARRLVLATGGESLPKSGSDGLGYRLAQALGHSIVPTTPALVPLLLDGGFHQGLAGVAHDVELCVRAEQQKPLRLRGALLFTHFGASGPVVLDASRHWLRARLEQRPVRLTARLVPDADAPGLDADLQAAARERPRQQLKTALAAWLPAALAAAVPAALGIGAESALGRLRRDERRRLVQALQDWPLPVRDSRGYGFAEVTAGGVPAREVDAASMGSRPCPGLHLVGEILDVDGRIGGFNFQWAWSSAWVAARAVVGSVVPPAE